MEIDVNEILSKYSSYIKGIIKGDFGHSLSNAELDDVFSEVTLTLCKTNEIKGEHSDESLKAWLKIITKNKCRDAYRKQRRWERDRQRQHKGDDDEMWNPFECKEASPYSAYGREEDAESQFLQTYDPEVRPDENQNGDNPLFDLDDPQDQEIIKLYGEDYSRKEIAGKLSLDENQVKKRLEKIKETIQIRHLYKEGNSVDDIAKKMKLSEKVVIKRLGKNFVPEEIEKN